MTLTVQNLRSINSGVDPESLLPGQLCFNLVDKVLYVGDGTNFRISVDGSSRTAPPGQGWFATPLSPNYFLTNPDGYSPAPTDGQILSFSQFLGKPVWENANTLGRPSSYSLTDTEVELSPGNSITAKINNALGVSVLESDTVIVTGNPGSEYSGYYIYQSNEWVQTSQYSHPSADQVPFDDTAPGLGESTLQGAIENLSANKLDTPTNPPDAGSLLSWSGVTPLWISTSSLTVSATQTSFDQGGTNLPPNNGDVQKALTTVSDIALTANALANNALPRTGGVMQGNITFAPGQPIDAGTY